MGGYSEPTASAVPGSGEGHPTSARTDRRVWLDNLKVLLISLIIVIHGVLGYSSLEVWTYTEYREVTLNPVIEAVLFLAAAPFALLMIPLLFLVSGLLTPDSVRRKGPGRFAVDRLVRLGVPFAVFVLLIEPALVYWLAHRLGAAEGTWFEEYLISEGRIDSGPLWFVGVLLVFSGFHAAWVALRPRREPALGEATVAGLLLASAGVAAASFLVRLAFRYGSEAGPSDLNFWEWPACAVAFGLGVAGAGQGWLDGTSPTLHRGCRRVTVIALAAMTALLFHAGWTDRFDQVLGGWSWFALAFAVVEAPLALCGSVWLLGVAQRRLDGRFPGDAALTRASYAAFVVQGVSLLGLSLALRPVGLPAEAKAVLVAVGSLVGSFGLAWVLVRLPLIRHVL